MVTDSVICSLGFGAVTARGRARQRVDFLDDMVRFCATSEACHRI